MASEVEIANRALSKLGEARIASLADASKPARAMNARFALLRDAELAASSWRFAVTRTTLPASTSTPAWGYSKIYERPTDDVRPLKVGDAFVDYRAMGVMFETSGVVSDRTPYEIIGNKIHTDLSAPLKYEYVKRETDSGQFDALFVEALACRLALDACEELTQSASKMDRIERQYRAALSEARRVNAILSPPRRRDAGRFMQARVY